MPRRLVAIVGATATGKTAVGEALAARLGGAVVCADARQVYRELEIATGKPTPEERAARPHHLFDRWGLGGRATAGGWARAAAAVCERCFAARVPPVLVGGSGLYLGALRRGLHPEPPRDEAVREALAREWRASGPEAMHARLAALDPGAAAALRVRDRQRVLRALEIVTVGGRPLRWWRERPLEPPLEADWRTLELVAPPDVLAARIDARARAMWGAGLPGEVRAIVAAGRGEALRSLRAIGYDEALAVLEGALGEDAALSRMALRTRQLAKRQRTWFRHQLPSETAELEPGGAEALAERLAGEHRRGAARAGG
jgi:tRNA dimethylallyltransferase